MNIEQIADAVSQEMLMHVAELQPELVKWNREFLRRCLSKLAEQAGEPVAYQSTRNGFIAKENKNPEYNVGLYTETQLLAAQQRAAKAIIEPMAKVIYRQWYYLPEYTAWVDGGNSFKQDDARRIARNVVERGDWREYL